MSSSNVDYEEMVKKMTNQVINQIQLEIQNRVIEVAQQQIDVNPIIKKKEMKKKSKKTLKYAHQPTLNELREIKQSKLQEIKELQMREDSLKKSAILEKSKVSNSCSKLWRSEFTEEEMSEIKKIMKNQKHFEKQLRKKQSNLQNWLLQKKKQDQELKKQYIAQQCEQRRKELTKQRQELQMKKQERTVQLEQQIKKLKQLKQKKWLHQEMSRSWQKYEETSEIEKQKLWEMQKEKRKMQATQISQHEMKYLEMKKEMQKKREKALEESRSLKNHLPYIHAQIYYKVQKQEEEKSRLETVKSHEKEDNIVKKKLFSKQVLELYLPKVKQSPKKTQEDSEPLSPSKPSLNTQQVYKLGNAYMKTVHQKVTTSHIEKQKKSLIVTEEPGGNSIFYKNYLKDLKSQHHKQNNGNTLSAVQLTLRSNKLSSTDKLHKVRMMFQKDKGKKRSDTQLIETIKSKMKILQEIVR